MDPTDAAHLGSRAQQEGDAMLPFYTTPPPLWSQVALVTFDTIRTEVLSSTEIASVHQLASFQLAADPSRLSGESSRQKLGFKNTFQSL
jgi:hypothetical protein